MCLPASETSTRPTPRPRRLFAVIVGAIFCIITILVMLLPRELRVKLRWLIAGVVEPRRCPGEHHYFIQFDPIAISIRQHYR